MNNKRPINLDLMTMAFPLPAIVSILHRISGVIIALFSPALLWLLARSLSTPWDFYQVQDDLNRLSYQLLTLIFLSALFFHLIAGVRHMLMDMGIGESLHDARLSAKLVVALSIVGVILAGVWIW